MPNNSTRLYTRAGEKTHVVDKLHLQQAYQDQCITTTEMDFWHVSRPSEGCTDVCSYVSTSTSSSFISLALPTIGVTFGWKTFVRLDANRLQYYWLRMANNFYTYTNVRDCRECAWNRPADKNRRPVQLFPGCIPLELEAMDILRLLRKTLKGNHFVLVMTDWYSKLTRALPTSETTVLHIVLLFVDIFPFGTNAPVDG